MNLSIVIPNYNGENLLAKNLPVIIDSLRGYSGKYEVIISDDHSTDNSAAVVSEISRSNPEARIKWIGSNKDKSLGFSFNVNKGVLEAEGEILFLLNSDVRPHKDFWKPILQHFKDPKVFAVGALEESVEDGNKRMLGRGVGKWKKGFLVHSAGDLDKKDTLWVSCGSGAFNRKIWEDLGGLDTLYDPFYWEDIDISYRARKSGYRTLFEKNSTVIHEHDEGAIKKLGRKTKSTVYRNQIIFAWKNSDLGNLLQNILWLPYHLITTLLAGDFDFWVGLFSALIILPKIVRSRSKAKKIFVLSDKEVTLT